MGRHRDDLHAYARRKVSDFAGHSRKIIEEFCAKRRTRMRLPLFHASQGGEGARTLHKWLHTHRARLTLQVGLKRSADVRRFCRALC